MSTEPVTLFNEDGLEIGIKPRNEIDKQKDIFPVVYVRILIDGKIFLTRVMKKEGGIAKIHEGKWGLPVATILRSGESQKEAFQRACISDIGVVPQITKSYEKRLIRFQNSSPRIVFTYDAVLPEIPTKEGLECTLVQQADLKAMYEEGILAETALVFE